MSQPSLESQLNPRLESFIRMDGAGRRRGERRESSRKESAEREKGERESLVISISIPSTACAVRQPVCPNKQPAEGGRLIITSPLFSHPEFTFHLTTNTRPGLWPCPLTPLEFRDVSGPSKATVHMLFGTWRGQYGTRQRPGREEEEGGRTKTQCEFMMSSPLEHSRLPPSTARCIVRRLSTLETSSLHTPATFPSQHFITERSPGGGICTRLAQKPENCRGSGRSRASILKI